MFETSLKRRVHFFFGGKYEKKNISKLGYTKKKI
jgi:hypothetical protein